MGGRPHIISYQQKKKFKLKLEYNFYDLRLILRSRNDHRPKFKLNRNLQLNYKSPANFFMLEKF